MFNFFQMKKIIKLFGYIKAFKKYVVLNIIFNLLAIIFGLFSLTMVVPFLQILFNPSSVSIPDAMPAFRADKEILLDMLYFYIWKISTKDSVFSVLLFICFSVILLFFLKNFTRYMAMYFIAPVRNGVVRNIRNNIYNKVLILPLSFFSKERKGDIIARFTSDVQEVEWSILSFLEMIFRDPFAIIFYLFTLFIISPHLTLFSVLLLPFSLWLIIYVGKSLRRTSVKVQNKLGSLFSIVEESISGLRIIKSFNAICFSNARFCEENNMFFRLSNRLFRKRDLASPLSEFLGACVLVIIIMYGGKLILDTETLTADMFILYILVFSQMIPPAKAITTAFYNIQRGMAPLERIEYILTAQERIVEIAEPEKITNFHNFIRFENVSLKYDDANIEALNNISLEIKKGEKIALVGESGAGKSTLIDLLPRFYDVTSGNIYIDDIHIKNIHIDSLRNLFGIVSQETILFNDTFRNNIAFGLSDITVEQLTTAAKMANAHDFIVNTPNGYDTITGDLGAKLSGGEKQRISLARTILRNRPVLLLDEATSELDSLSENYIQDALQLYMKDKTAIIIAHRLSTIVNTDKIVVMDKGQIVEQGKHQELLDKKGKYYELYKMQMFV